MEFGNDVYKVSFKTKSKDDLPLFGAEYDFHLAESVNCPEFLMYFPLLEKLVLMISGCLSGILMCILLLTNRYNIGTIVIPLLGKCSEDSQRDRKPIKLLVTGQSLYDKMTLAKR